MKQRVTVGRFTRETANALHDVYVLPTGRIYYRRNLGRFEEEIPAGPGALVDLRQCVKGLAKLAAATLAQKDFWADRKEIRRRAENHHCSYDTQFLDVDATSL